MAETEQLTSTPGVPSGNGQLVKAGVMPLFSTWVYLCEDGPRHLNAGLEQLAHRLMQEPGSAGRRSNHGGWHYAFDLFEREEPVVADFRDQMEQHVQAFLNSFRPAACQKEDRF